ncbi:MAG TPA: aminotransferase class V-fold PLP-dependent enzyme [Flavobacteriales bacterium]|nr:aminotransferase class V-fold PLP-dependent enzyme [Flavobacteriales bacterium]HRO39363.1 aminotransferase class V-fold PLP-dependent enzyme [Flavobacteriales bacterium]HRP80676.1 aminotransferase class V-fold PLP-dependent enzyme [Flavobacteriales bacterium]HRQ85204.1 aminotransferase class V-fold PLP-dependent enzyme [Flavobacteriales bacterium]
MKAPQTDWEKIRGNYPGLSGQTYLDTGSMGLMARSTVEAANAEHERLVQEGSTRGIHWMMEGLAQIAGEVAMHIGGDAKGTVLFQSFTAGLARIAPLLKHRPKVLLVGGDYPTLHGPFQWNGFEVVMLQPEADGSIPLARLEEAVKRERPQLVGISHVQWGTGHTIDLHAFGDLCRQYGAWSVVDITQSWCCVPIDLRSTPIDIIGGSGYKWPLAGFGNGFFHLGPEVRSELAEGKGFDPVKALAEGHLDPVAHVRLRDGLKRHAAIGAEVVWARVQELTAHAVQRLDAAGVRILNGSNARDRAGILIIEGGKERQALLKAANIPVQLRGAGLRLGIHFYNTEAEVERLVEVLR